MENLLTFIRSLTPFSDESWSALQPALSEKTYKRGALLLEAGTVCHSLFYIDTGYCRSFAVVDGTEKNTAFYFENNIATEIQSFGSGQKSTYSIKACEPVKAVIFDKAKLMAAAQETPEIETLGRNCIRLFSTKQQEFASLFQLYSPKDRLAYIEAHHPQFLRRIPLTQLASFLGIARETLSRIRKKSLNRNS